MVSKEGEIPYIENEDVQALDLELCSPPVLDHLVVFIRDPQNHSLYWYRKIAVSTDSVESKEGKKLEYVDTNIYDFEQMDQIPCPEEYLDKAVQRMVEAERGLSHAAKPEIRRMRAVVGVSRYNGNNRQTLTDLVILTAIKYHQMRSAALN